MASSYTAVQALALLKAQSLSAVAVKTTSTKTAGDTSVSSVLAAPAPAVITNTVKSGTVINTVSDLTTHLVTTMAAHPSYGSATTATTDLNTYTNILLGQAAGLCQSNRADSNAPLVAFKALETKIVTALQVLL